MKRIFVIGIGLSAALGLGLLLATKTPKSSTPGQAATPAVVALARDRIGAPAPDFTLKRVDGVEVNLASFRGKRPVVLVFASYTCDIFREQHQLLEQVYDRFKEHADFFMVYIREAHPSGGWVIAENTQRGISAEDPKTYDQRLALANTTCSSLNMQFPCVVDGLDNAIGNAYLAWPARIILVDQEGKIAVVSPRNPVGFAPGLLEVRKWLKKQFG